VRLISPKGWEGCLRRIGRDRHEASSVDYEELRGYGESVGVLKLKKRGKFWCPGHVGMEGMLADFFAEE